MLSELPGHQDRSHGLTSPSSMQLGTNTAGLCQSPAPIPVPALLLWLGAAGWHHMGEGTVLPPTTSLAPQLIFPCLSRCSLVDKLCHIVF